jgi:hypothetical protein
MGSSGSSDGDWNAAPCPPPSLLSGATPGDNRPHPRALEPPLLEVAFSVTGNGSMAGMWLLLGVVT